MKIGYLGPIGSFTYTASKNAYPNEELIAFASISECINAYEKKMVDLSIIPIENSIEGSVHQSVDYLFHIGVIEVCHEIVLPIDQQLMVVDSTKTIEKIISHPQALAQTERFRQENYPNVPAEMATSTAFAAKFVSEHPEKSFAAVAPKDSAKRYNLKIIAENIQDIALNNTRFWVLGNDQKPLAIQEVGKKGSLTLVLPQNLSGALHQALSVFANHKIDLTKIESRPLKTVLGEYFFLLDFIVEDELALNKAIDNLESLGIAVKSFGIYDVYEIKKEN